MVHRVAGATRLPAFRGAAVCLAQGLAALAAQLEARETAALCGQGAAAIAQAMSKTTDAFDLSHLAQAVAALAGLLDPKEAREATGLALKGMSKATDATTTSASAHLK